VIDLGVIEAIGDLVVDYREKPSFNYAVSAGIYLFEPAILEHIPRGERFDLPQLVLTLLERGLTVGRFAAQGQWLDIGRPDDYAEAVQLFESQRRAYLPASQARRKSPRQIDARKSRSRRAKAE
jgi:NDP-mannose synthase